MGQMIEDPRTIRIAPQGMVRVVHEDARDHWPTVEGDFADLGSARSLIEAGWAPRMQELALYDDRGNRLALA